MWSARIVGCGEAVDVGRGAGRGGEAAVAGDVVGVVVGLEQVLDPDAHVAREREVLVDLELRVHGMENNVQATATASAVDVAVDVAVAVVVVVVVDWSVTLCPSRSSWATSRLVWRSGSRLRK